MAEIENVMSMIGFAASRLKGRLDMMYGYQLDDHGRNVVGLHETVLPLCLVARSVFVARLPKTPNNSLSLELLPRLMAGQTEGSRV